MTYPELLYNDRAVMKLEPTNIGMDRLVLTLYEGNPAVVQLEPGDATRYCLLIVPAWSPEVKGSLDMFGIPSEHCSRYLLVTKMNGLKGTMGFVPLNDGVLVEHHFDEIVTNFWSMRLLAWWFEILKGRLISP